VNRPAKAGVTIGGDEVASGAGPPPAGDIGRRLWALFMLACTPEVAESILVGRPVMAANLDAEALRRARRGMSLPPPDSYIRVRHGHLDAIAEAGPLNPRSRSRR
jgi:hypothetical protein